MWNRLGDSMAGALYVDDHMHMPHSLLHMPHSPRHMPHSPLHMLSLTLQNLEHDLEDCSKLINVCVSFVGPSRVWSQKQVYCTVHLLLPALLLHCCAPRCYLLHRCSGLRSLDSAASGGRRTCGVPCNWRFLTREGRSSARS